MSALTWDSVPAASAGAPGALTGRARAGHLRLVPESTRAARPAPLRLTWLGRLVLVLAAVGVAVAVASTVLGSRAAASADGAMPDHAVTVQAGQTLSAIARAELPSLPVEVGVVRLQLANHLSSAQVRAGQVLVVPAS